MDIAGVALALIIIFIASLFFLNKSQSGGSDSGWSPITVPLQSNPYTQQINELDNVDFVLKRKQFPGREEIDRLSPIDEAKEYLSVLPKKSIADIPKHTLPTTDKVIIEAKQPYFLDEALVVNYYGVPHYWDWRYPRQPLPIEFAKDPQKFIKEHPEIYPSYIISSRDTTLLQDS